MSTSDPPPPNPFFARRREAGESPRIPPAVQKAILLLLAVLMVAGGTAYKFGWFPFDNRAQLADELKADVLARAGLSLVSVEVTGEGTGVGTLDTGERLAVRWKWEDGRIHSLCQRPKDEVVARLRNALEKKYGPVKEVRIEPSPTGVGYVGEVVLESRLIYDIFESTDLEKMTCSQWEWQSSRNYAWSARERFEKAVGEPVLEVTVLRDGDFPTPLPASAQRFFAARMRTAGGWYAVELSMRQDDPNADLEVRYRKLGQ